MLSSSLFITPVTVLAVDLPTGGKVIVGTATINQSGSNQLLINQASQNAILEFDTFSIGKDGHVHFANGNGSTLNRVTGGYQSKIDGRLSATGSLLLINPNGVIIGRDGTIDTGGSFLASTRDITNADFLDGGDNTFFGDSDAAVIILGKVSSLGGDITLIAHQVVNDGTLEASNGTVGLASGVEILLRDNDHADGRILVKAGKSGGSVTHSGAIKAANAELRAHSGHVYALAQNRKGTIQVTGAKKSGGRVFLTANGGKVVTNQKITAKRRVVNKATQKTTYQGGDVFINADIVDVAGLIDVSGDLGGNIDIGAKNSITLDNATLDASGVSDGGRIRVGGEYRGGQGLEVDEVQNTDKLLITETSIFDASSEQGDGGRVIAWSDGNTYFGGDIDVSAGSDGGNGGFVETSGLEGLAISAGAYVNALSVNGLVGDWLLDPRTVTIQSGGTATLTEIANAADTTSDLIIDPTAINGAAANVSIVATETINFQDDVNMTNSGVGINAQSGGDININSAITSTGLILLIADADTSGAGGISFGAGGVISARDVELSSGEAIDLGSITTTQNLTVNTTGDAIVQSAALNIAGTSVFDATAGGSAGANVRLGNAGNDFGGAVDVAGTDVVLRDLNSIELGDIDASGSLTVNAVDTISDGATVGSNSDVNVGGYASLSANTIVLEDMTNDFAGRVDLFGGDLTISDANDIVFERITASGNLIVNAGGSIADSTVCGECPDISVAGTSDLNAVTTITLDNSLNDFGGAVDAAGTDIQISDQNDLIFGDVDASGNLVAVAGGSITDNGDGAASGDDIDVAGTSNLTANDEVTLDDAFNDFGGRVVASGDGVRLKDINTIVLGNVNANTGAVVIDAPIIDLDGDLTGSSISGMASLVNVLGTTNGANIPDAIDVGAENATINLAAGTYGSFTADKNGQTFSGTGTGTVIRTGSPAITVTANGVTLENMLLQGVGVPAADDHGILLDGTTSPNLTGVVINNITFNNLQDGVRAEGVIGNGDTTSVDVTIKNSTMGTIAGRGVHFIDTLDAANILIGGATLADANFIDAADDAVLANDLINGTVFSIANNSTFYGGGDGVEFAGAISGGSNVIISGNQYIEGIGSSADEDDLGDGIVFRGPISGAQTSILIEDSIQIQGLDRGINFASSGTGGPATIEDASITISGNQVIRGNDLDGILFNADITNANITIGGATAADGNLLVDGEDEAIDIQNINGGSVTIANNVLVQGQTGNGIEIEGPVSNGADVEINQNGIEADEDGIIFDGTVIDATVAISQNDIVGDDEGIEFDEAVRRSTVRINTNDQIVGTNGQGILFDDLIRNSDITIGGATDTLGNTLISGGDDAIETQQIRNSRFNIANNETIIGDDEAIDINGRVRNGSIVNIAGNTEIIGDDSAIKFSAQTRSGSEINIAGNELIDGLGDAGIIFEGAVRDSTVNIGATSSDLDIDGTSVGFGQNEQIIGAIDGIATTTIRDSAFNVADNGSIVGGEDGIFIGNVRNSDVEISANEFIFGGFIGSGIQFTGNVTENSNINILNNGFTAGLGAGIFFGDITDIGGTRIDDSNVEISGNTGIGGVLGGIMFASELVNDADVLISNNDFTLGALFGIDFMSDIIDSSVEISDNGIIVALGTGIQIGSILNPGSTVLENSTFIIADNDAVIGLAGNGIHATAILDGSTFQIIDNETIQGGQDGIRTDELIVDSTLTISGNQTITGLESDGVHIDGPTFLSTVRIDSNNEIIGDDDGIDIAIVDDSNVFIRNNQLIEGNEHGIEFDDSFRAGSIIGQSNIRIVGNDHINGKFSDAIVVKSDIRGQSQFSVLRNNEITGGGNGILFAGDIRNGSDIRIAENGTAELNGQAYDPNEKVNYTFATSRFVSGVEGSSVAFYGDVQDRARVNINRNMLGDSYDGISFYGDVTSTRTQRVSNNFILQNSNSGIAFGSDFSQQSTTVSSSFEIFQNYIIQNRNSGISVGALTNVGSGVNIHQNFIPGSGFNWGNQNFAINNQGSGSMNIDGNWWGSANAAEIALTIAGVAVPTDFLTSGQDTNIELALGASNFDPFAFQGGSENPTNPVDPQPADISCEISLDESDLIDFDNLADRDNQENRIEARCTEDPEEIGEVTILLGN